MIKPLRGLVCGVALVVALSPMAASAQTATTQHLQDELANANAQFQLAVGESQEIRADAQLSAQNERMIALLESEAFRLRQLDLVANATALEDITKALATAARSQGDLNARNELIIAQGRAAVLVAKADADMANALAIGRTDEIANAKAQGMFMREVASAISGSLAETKMNSARIQSEMRADILHTPGLAELDNGRAMGANELLAADTTLAAAEIAFNSAELTGEAEVEEVLDHASDSLQNARVMLDNALEGDDE
jgi:hypothetical protein